MSTQNKQIKIGTDTDFKHNEILNAKIDASKNEIINGSNIKLFNSNTTINNVLSNKQNKLVAGRNITIDDVGNFWTDFGGLNNHNLELVNEIPEFESINIIFKATCFDTETDDNALLCRTDNEIYFGILDANQSPSIYNGDWTEGQTKINLNETYWYCLNSTDAQTFTYYTIKDNNYTLSTLPELSAWHEECSIEDNIFANKKFYIGYNPFTSIESWKGNIFECRILVDNAEWFNLSIAEEGVDYINNGCTYVGEILNPVISAPSIDLIPDQTDNAGKFLTTDGSTASWGNPNEVVELPEETNIDEIMKEGTFFIKNPTGTLPYSVSIGSGCWCILTQEKCYDENVGTYWYVQTAKFSYLGYGPGIGSISSWQTYTRQLTDYPYLMGATWQRLDNMTERIFDATPISEGTSLSINLNSYSDSESNSIINAGYINGLGWRSIKSLTLTYGLNGSCKIFFKTYSGTPPYDTTNFSITLDGTISAQIINPDILTNYEFKFNTMYGIDFQKMNSSKFYITIIEIDKPFVQEVFPTQKNNSGKFLTTDGNTLSWSKITGTNLYDTKVLSQAISNKGWAYQCKSVRTDLAKADVPTVYNDIEYKYLNCDKVPSSSLTQLAGTSPYKTVDIDDTYVYSGDTTDWKLKRTRLDNLPAVNWETVINSQLSANLSFRALCVGEKILIASFKGANNSVDIKVYKKSDWTLLKTYNHTYNNGMACYCSPIYVNGVKKFVVGYKDTEMSINSSYMVFLEDNDTLQETVYTLSYQQNCIPVYINGYYIFMHRNQEGITKYITRTTDFINFENVFSYDGWSYDNVQPIGKAGNKLICFHLKRVSSDNGETWVTDNSIPSDCNASSICQKENSFYIISRKNILFSDNLPSFTTVYTGANDIGNFITVNDSADMFFIKKDYPLYFLGYNSVVYTDNYTINGSIVNIQYYKYDDWKICIAGENGTDDINLDTVFDDLGYLNYWRLDRNGQTVTLPRNSNLYTQMFVDDNYEDLGDNLITADWSATALKSELDIIPDQTGNSGKFLTTNGTTLSWAEVQGGGSDLPDQTGQSGKFLTTNGSTASWATVSSGTSDYSSLSNKPTINSVELNGNKTSNDLGLQSKLTWTYNEGTETLEVE